MITAALVQRSLASVIKQLKKRFAVCFRETFFTALQQEDINDLLRVSFPVQINRVIIIIVYCLYITADYAN